MSIKNLTLYVPAIIWSTVHIPSTFQFSSFPQLRSHWINFTHYMRYCWSCNMYTMLEPKTVPHRPAKKTKYLGVQIDCSLDWKEQIKATSAKVSRALGFLKYAKKFLPREALRTLYTSIVEPHFRYCCSAWGCCGITGMSQLQKLQNRAQPNHNKQQLWCPKQTTYWKTRLEDHWTTL